MFTHKADRHVAGLVPPGPGLGLVSLKVKSRKNCWVDNICRVEEVKNRPSVLLSSLLLPLFICSKEVGRMEGGRERGGCMFSFPAQPLRLQAARGEETVERGEGTEGGRQTEESRGNAKSDPLPYLLLLLLHCHLAREPPTVI